jgi:hypothetical protein
MVNNREHFALLQDRRGPHRLDAKQKRVKAGKRLARLDARRFPAALESSWKILFPSLRLFRGALHLREVGLNYLA